MADSSHIELHKNANISVIDEDICRQFHIKMQHKADYGQQQEGFQPSM